MALKKPAKATKKTADTRDIASLAAVKKALDATQHNPVNFAPIIAFVAPILARIAARYVLRAVARKLNRKISQKVRDETVVGAADYLADVAVKRAIK